MLSWYLLYLPSMPLTSTSLSSLLTGYKIVVILCPCFLPAAEFFSYRSLCRWSFSRNSTRYPSLIIRSTSFSTPGYMWLNSCSLLKPLLLIFYLFSGSMPNLGHNLISSLSESQSLGISALLRPIFRSYCNLPFGRARTYISFVSLIFWYCLMNSAFKNASSILPFLSSLISLNACFTYFSPNLSFFYLRNISRILIYINLINSS